MNRITLKTIAAAFAIFWHGISPAPAQIPGMCFPEAMVIQSAKEHGLTEKVVLSPEQAAIADKWYAAIPPVSEPGEFNQAIVFRGEGGIGIALGRNGIYCVMSKLGEDEARTLDEALAGGSKA